MITRPTASAATAATYSSSMLAKAFAVTSSYRSLVSARLAFLPSFWSIIPVEIPTVTRRSVRSASPASLGTISAMGFANSSLILPALLPAPTAHVCSALLGMRSTVMGFVCRLTTSTMAA